MAKRKGHDEEGSVPSRPAVEAREHRPVTFTSAPYLPEDTPVIYSDGLMLGASSGVFILSFMQVQFPLVNRPEQWETVTTIQNKCVARIVVSHENMLEFYKVISDLLEPELQALQTKEAQQQ